MATDGRTIDDALIRTLMYEELSKITAAEQAMFGEDELKAARDLFEKLIFEDDFTEFLTLPAYEHLVPPGAP